MADIELKAPRRQVRRDSENFIPILLVVVTVIGGGFAVAKHEAKRQEAAEQKKAEAAVKAEEPAQSNGAGIRQRVQKNINERQSQPVVTTESGRIYYAPQTGAPAYEADELSTADHYRIAIQIMQQSRQVQKQIDRQQYGEKPSVSAAQPNTTSNSSTCLALRQQKEALDERMRRYGYDNFEAERLHEEWREINRQMVRFQCH